MKHWWRYFDDIFACVSNKQEAITVLTYINQQHPNIRFTVEHETNSKLPFLDTSVIRKANGYCTTIYCEKTFTGVYLNWTSLTARRYKICLIRCLAERIWRIVSDKDERLIEIEKLKIILTKNEYPIDDIDQTITKFLELKSRQETSSVATVEKLKRFLKLPYVNRRCEDYAFRLKQLIESN